tara:strand:+ start:326 stop:505 length:180 start_codon:yes stop_codon:yes gene_type:complete
MERPQTPKGGVMKKIKEAVRRRKAQKGYDLPDKYKNVRDLQWSDDLERELLKVRWAMGS